MTNDRIKSAILNGETYLGIELGSTRIKAVLIDTSYAPIASGDYIWENRLKDGYWTYDLEEVWQGIQGAYKALRESVKTQYETNLEKINAIGVSGMMHGYLAFDQEDRLLVPFRTWRNNLQKDASEALTQHFDYPIPQRWSIAHLYQAILNREDHVKEIGWMTTLAGYVHYQLTGQKVLGVGEASGMFPIDLETQDFDAGMITLFQDLLQDHNLDLDMTQVLPRVLVAGQKAGHLTTDGASLLDPTGTLRSGIVFAPPEGDAGTGMVATNTVAQREGVVSAGTSIFGMAILEGPMKTVHEAIDLVMTPSGNLVAMVHANNCTSDLNAWVGLFKEVLTLFGENVDEGQLFEKLYKISLSGDKSCHGMMSYGYLSGEHITGFSEGKPLFVRQPDSSLDVANFMRTHLYSALAVMKIGFDILFEEEGIRLDRVLGHGGLFKTQGVAQSYLSAALNTPVSVMETAGEGGPYGMALLAAYTNKADQTLSDFLKHEVFRDVKARTHVPDPSDVQGFKVYVNRYKAGLKVEASAVESL